MDNIDKVPPHNLDAERSVLGSMILDNNAIHKVTEILNSNSFYRKAHSIIFNAIIELDNNSKAVDLVTVSEKLKSKEQLDDIGGSGYITALANSVPTTQNVGQYANIVKEKYDLRKLIKIGDKIQNLGYQDDNSKDAIFKAEELVYNLTQSQKRGERHHIKDILLEIADSIERRLDGDIKTLETPFSDINNMLSAGGFEPQTLNIIMARPSMGKTAFMLNLASYWGIQQNKPLSIYSLETEKKLVVQRMLSIHNGVPLSGFKRPELLDDEKMQLFWEKFGNVAGLVGEKEVYVCDKAGLTISELKSHIIQDIKQKNVEVVFIDYLQLIEHTDNRLNDTQKLGKITKILKNLARDYDIPIILISQLNRAVEKRNNKRPMMADARASGNIEEDADFMSALYRDDYYNPDSEKEGITEFIILKQKEGAVGTVELYFNKQLNRFENLAKGGNN